MLGIYIHIPFCGGKCPYCNFYSVSYNKVLVKKFIDAVLEEIKIKSRKEYIVDSIYFGGGTPSLLYAKEISKLINEIKKYYNVKKDAEITIELNPKTVNKEKFNIYKDIGINRLSFGVQSFCDAELKQLGRRHTKKQAISIINLAKECGFNNISVDIIIGTAGQTKESLKKTLNSVFSLNISHVSIYQLKIEKGTEFYINPPKGLLSDDEVSNLYIFVCEELQKNYFFKYEISNFAKEGKKSRHNIKYWTMKDYLGFGPSAHSFFKGVRFFNEPSIEKYIKNPTSSKKEPVDINFEWFILGLRLEDGLFVEEIKRRNFWTKNFELNLKRLQEEKFLEVSKKRIKLTTKGSLVQNSIITYLLE